MLTPLAHQAPIFYLPKFELLIRTPYFWKLPTRQDPIFCLEAGLGSAHLCLLRTALYGKAFCREEFHASIGLFDFFDECQSRQ